MGLASKMLHKGTEGLRKTDGRIDPKSFGAWLDLLWLCFWPGLVCFGSVGVALLLLL